MIERFRFASAPPGSGIGVFEACQPRRGFLSAALFLLASSLFTTLLAGLPAEAQDRPADKAQRPSAPPGTEAIQSYLRGSTNEMPEALRARLSPREQAALQRRRAERSGAQRAQRKAIGGRPEIEPSQSFAINPNPTPKLNLGRFSSNSLRRAGDIDGDGTEDYLYNANIRLGGSLLIADGARDERTPELEDRTGKTAVYFGGTPEEEEDQFFYRSLRPVGDINGDGYADAAAFDIENGTLRLYVGSPSGYQDSGVTKSLSLDFLSGGFFRVVRAFTDLDGDGFGDVLIGESFGSSEIEVLFGASELEDAETRRYDVEGGFFAESAYNTANLSGDGDGQIVRLFGRDPVSMRVYSINSTRSLETIRSLDAEELESGADDYQLSLVDLTGDGAREAVAAASETYAFRDTTEADSVAYGSTPEQLTGPATEALRRPVPVGDLDGDGRHDFLVSSSGDARHVSYGPPDLSGELTFDTELPADPGTELDVRYIPTGSFGDVTGNGRPDLILELIDDSEDEIGNRFASVTSSREVASSADVRVPQGHVFDSIQESNELGDVNGDGIGDFAVVRTNLDQVEVYYGGASVPEEPAQTLQEPSDTLAPVTVSAGDVTGNGAPDVVVGHRAGERIDVYEGGGSLSSTPDQTIRASDAGVEALREPRVIGDVSGDGVADLLISNQGNFGFGDIPERLFVLFGGPSLPSQPDRMIEYADSSGSRHVPVTLGDVSGDGTADFAVGRPEFEASSEAAEGRVDVYFGESSSFDAPDVTLRPANADQDIRGFGDAIASGDFNGDGTDDLATRPSSVDPSGPTSSVQISIYNGDTDFDDEANRRVQVPAAPLEPSVSSSGRGGLDGNGDGLADEGIRGAMENLNVSGSDADALLLASNGDGAAVNALLYQPQVSTGPTRVLEASNQDADLGGEGQNVAVGDVTGDETPDAVLVQHRDENDAAVSSRFYRYSLEGFPVAARSLPVDTSGTFEFGGSTGVDLRFNGVSGAGQVTVQKYDDGPSGTGGIEETNVSSYRLVIGAEPSLSFDSTEIQLAVGTLDGIGDPSAVTMYKRPDVGTGAFDSLETRVGTAGTPGDISDDTLYASTDSFSEFVLASNSDDNPLPVELAGFDATVDGSKIQLSWQTASETGNAGFQIQRRVGEQANGEKDPWTTVGSVEGTGTTTEAQSYRYVDTDLPYEADRLTYRLRQVDTDGSEHFSEEVTVERSVTEVKLLGTYPNPARQRATVRYALPETQDVTLELYDVLGRQVRTVVRGEKEGRHEQRLDTSGLSSGVYFLRLQAEGAAKTQRLTVMR